MVGPFGPQKETEIVEVLTPHRTGTVQFIKLIPGNKTLVVEAKIDGYTSHLRGSRNLDMIAGGDFDGDGDYEVLVPSFPVLDRLAAIRHTTKGAIKAWEVPLGGNLTSNIATASLADGTLAVAAGTQAGMIKVWQ